MANYKEYQPFGNGHIKYADIQHYTRYLPTAFDESMTMLEKTNKIIEFLNWVIRNSNDLSDHTIENLKEMRDDINVIITKTLPENLEKVLIQWDKTGFLQDMINKNTHERIDGVEDSIAQVNNSKVDRNGTNQVTWANLTQEAKENIAGNKIAVVGENSVSYPNIVNNGVNVGNINIADGFLPKNIIYFLGGAQTQDSPGVNARARTNIMRLDPGTVVKLKNTSSPFQLAVFRFTDDDVYEGSYGGYSKNSVTITDNSKIAIGAKKDDDSLFTQNELKLLSSEIVVFKEKYLKLDDFYTLNPVFSKFGEYRIKSNTVRLPINTKIVSTLPVEFYLIEMINGEETLNDTGWGNPKTVERESDYRIYVRWTDEGTITDDDIDIIIKSLSVKSQDDYLQMRDLSVLNDNVLSTVYVSHNGNDDNNGLSHGTSFKTLQKALDSGAETIYMETGEYVKQSASKRDITNLKILPYKNNYTNQKNEYIIFNGADKITDLEEYETIYRKEYRNNDQFKKVFIDKTLPLETGGNRPTYNAALWEGHDNVNDIRLQPVLTLEECKNTENSFYYDGVHVYINPTNKDNVFHAVNQSRGIDLSGENINLKNIVTSFYTGDPFNLDNISNLELTQCGATHSSTTDGFSLDYTDGKLYKCFAHKNRNDGFNMHFKGDTILYDCNGSYNYDDGVSHHEICTGTIFGGQWNNNIKGGIIPVNDAKVNVYNAVIKNNNYGFYTTQADVISKGNHYIGNNVGIQHGGDGVDSYGDVFINNDKDTVGVVNKN